jgi:hypothetical protein
MRKPLTGIGTIVGFAAILFLLTMTAYAAEKYKVIEIPTGQRLIDSYPLGTVRMYPSVLNHGMSWLDNTRLLFPGFTPVPSPPLRGISGKTDSGVFIWDIEENKVTRYSNEVGFCHAAGWIYLLGEAQYDTVKQSGRMNYRVGPIGQEKAGLCIYDTKQESDCIHGVNLSCRPADYTARPLGPQSQLLVELRSGDGAIVANPSTRNRPRDTTREQVIEMSRRPIWLVNQAYPQGRNLPIQEVEKIHSAAYSEYAKKYILLTDIPKNGKPGVHSNWPIHLKQPVYLLDRNGDVETIEVPNPKTEKERDWTNIDIALPTRAGIIFDGSHGRKGGGIFLYDGKQVTTIDVGQVRALAVTPDGCKAAWAIINDYGRGLLDQRIKYMNVCQGGH